MEQSKSAAVGGMGSAVVVAPGPEQTATATGRSRMSVSTSVGTLKRFDPGDLGSYKVPGRNMALRGIAGRRFGDDIFISIGTDYSKYLRKWGYEMMEHAQDGAIGQMEIDQGRTLRKVARV